MTAYILKRLFLLLPTLAGILILAFVFLYSSGVSPARAIYGDKATPEMIAELERINGWDLPLHRQIIRYFKNAVRGDLGRTAVPPHRSVILDLKTCFPATLELSFTALFIAVLAGVSVGVLSAVKPYTWFDYLTTLLAMAGISVPVFWLGMLMILAFGQWLPYFGRVTPELFTQYDFTPKTNLLLIDTLLYGTPQMFADVLKHLILPAFALSTIPMAVIARITRSAMVEAMQADHIRTAKAKGLPGWKIVWRHAFRSALPQVSTVIGLQCGALLGGAILTETIFSWPGMGKYLIDSVMRRDYNAVMGCLVLATTAFLLINLLVDLSYAWFDPRVRDRLAGGRVS